MSAGSPDAGEAIHATALVVGEGGVLIRGPAGSGKSSLALALLAVARTHGWFAGLIGDDRIFLSVHSGRVTANGAPNMFGFIERRGQGVVEAPAEPRAIVRLIVDLPASDGGPQRMPDEKELNVPICGIDVPRIAFPQGISALDRAYAVWARLDKIRDKNMTGLAHFA